MQSGWLDEFMRRDRHQSQEPPVQDVSAQGAGGVSRRGFLPGGGAAGMAAAGALASQQVAQAQAPAGGPQETPIGPKWWPSRWGAQDEAGASNWITPAKVLESAKLIKRSEEHTSELQ